MGQWGRAEQPFAGSESQHWACLLFIWTRAHPGGEVESSSTVLCDRCPWCYGSRYASRCVSCGHAQNPATQVGAGSSSKGNSLPTWVDIRLLEPACSFCLLSIWDLLIQINLVTLALQLFSPAWPCRTLKINSLPWNSCIFCMLSKNKNFYF